MVLEIESRDGLVYSKDVKVSKFILHDSLFFLKHPAAKLTNITNSYRVEGFATTHCCRELLIMHGSFYAYEIEYIGEKYHECFFTVFFKHA